jgi:amino acid transporter
MADAWNDKGDVKVYADDHVTDVQHGVISDNKDELQRHLGNRQIQLLAIGGSIGTALFVSIGSGLHHAGPASLFLAYTLYSCMLGLVNNCIAEMTVFMPVSGGFIRLAGEWVDDAFGFMWVQEPAAIFPMDR